MCFRCVLLNFVTRVRNKAVANGALLSRIDPENHIVKTRVARATYGIPHYVFVDENNPEHLLRKSKWEEHSSGIYRIPGAFDPIFRKVRPPARQWSSLILGAYVYTTNHRVIKLTSRKKFAIRSAPQDVIRQAFLITRYALCVIGALYPIHDG